MDELNIDELFFELDDLWPSQKGRAKTKEKKSLKLLLTHGVAWDFIRLEVEKLIAESPKKIPDLDLFLIKIMSKTSPKEVVSTIQNVPEVVEDSSEVDKVFEEIWAAWPQFFDPAQHKPTAKKVFLNKARNRPLDEIKQVCLYYAAEHNVMSNGLFFPKWIKTFLSSEDEETYETWRQQCFALKGEVYDRSYFDAAWNWYPDFTDRKLQKTKVTGLLLYRRFINDSNRIDFLCACKAYRSIKMEDMTDDDGNPKPEEEYLKFVKSFQNFFQYWESLRKDKMTEFDQKIADFIIEEYFPVMEKYGYDPRSVFGAGQVTDWIRAEIVMKKSTAMNAVSALMRETFDRLRLNLDPRVATEIIVRMREKSKKKMPLPVYIGGIPLDEHPDKDKYLTRYNN